jgi:hypothetical protein
VDDDRIAAEKIRARAQKLGFQDWVTGDLGALEADVRSSRILEPSKELRAAAETNDLAEVLTVNRPALTDRRTSRAGGLARKGNSTRAPQRLP